MSAKDQTVTIKGLRDLILHITTNSHLTGIVMLANKKFSGPLCVIGIPGLTSEIYKQNQARMPLLSAKGILVKLSAESKRKQTGDILHLPVERKAAQKGKKKRPDHDTQEETSCDLESLLLSPHQIEENGFPGLEALTAPGSVYRRTAEVLTAPHAVALDCEMCVTAAGYELTRCAVLSMDCEVLYDQYVKPDNPILDYKTEFSGIIASHLEGVTKRLEDVQNDLLAMISSSTIIIGHALHNDFRALRLVHDRIADTAALFPHRSGLPNRSALRWLAHSILHKSVQGFNADKYLKPEGDTDDAAPDAPAVGHSPVEDARTCVELVRMKLRYGPDFGVDPNTVEHIFQVIRRAKLFTPAAVDEQSALAKTFPEWSWHPAETPEEITAAASQLLAEPTPHVVFTQLPALQLHLDLGLPEPAAPPPPGKFFKTRLCSSFETRSLCLRQDHCSFAHGAAELRPVPPRPTENPQAGSTEVLTASPPESDAPAPLPGPAEGAQLATEPVEMLAADKAVSADPSPPEPATTAAILEAIDATIHTIWARAPHNTAFIVYGGRSPGSRAPPPPQRSGAPATVPLFLFPKWDGVALADAPST